MHPLSFNNKFHVIVNVEFVPQSGNKQPKTRELRYCSRVLSHPFDSTNQLEGFTECECKKCASSHKRTKKNRILVNLFVGSMLKPFHSIGWGQNRALLFVPWIELSFWRQSPAINAICENFW